MRNKLLLVLLFALMGCKKDAVLIKSGIETRAFGKLTDYRDKPISNLKVKVGEFKITNSGSYIVSYDDYEFIDWVDSTYTNTEGNYDSVFKTSGKGNFYRLFFSERTKEKEPQVIWDPFFIDITESSNDMKYIGKEFEFNTVNLIELYPCQITFKVNLQTFPITPSHNLTYPSNLKNIMGNGTSVQTIYIQKYLKETFNLYRTKNGKIQSTTYEFPASNVEGITYQSITVEESDFKDVE
ncbi:hypothetical protein [Flavobacterium sp. LAR06]|uniref:hypothetical protein n=1 Tax=Flavobacterium sp. LAR06 TaxID=3064897 RepID=UPI0035C064EF